MKRMNGDLLVPGKPPLATNNTRGARWEVALTESEDQNGSSRRRFAKLSEGQGS